MILWTHGNPMRMQADREPSFVSCVSVPMPALMPSTPPCVAQLGFLFFPSFFLNASNYAIKRKQVTREKKEREEVQRSETQTQKKLSCLLTIGRPCRPTSCKSDIPLLNREAQPLFGTSGRRDNYHRDHSDVPLNPGAALTRLPLILLLPPSHLAHCYYYCYSWNPGSFLHLGMSQTPRATEWSCWIRLSFCPHPPPARLLTAASAFLGVDARGTTSANPTVNCSRTRTSSHGPEVG